MDFNELEIQPLWHDVSLYYIFQLDIGADGQEALDLNQGKEAFKKVHSINTFII